MRNYLFIILVLLFSGCASKEYYKPKNIENETIYIEKSLPSKIDFFTKKSATLENGELLPQKEKIQKGFISINTNLGKKGSILLVNNKKEIPFQKLIVTATKKGNLIAVLFVDNSFKLFDLEKNSSIFEYKFSDSLGLRKFIATPLFYKDLLVIPTLNGKLAIFDLKELKLIRTIVIAKKDYFNNLIFLEVKNDNLIASTRGNLLVISPTNVFEKSFNIKHILVKDNNIFIFTNEGDIKKFDFHLKELNSISFKYANIISPIFVGDSLFFVENGNGSYLIKTDKNLSTKKVYKLVSENLSEVNTFAKNGILYIGDEYIDLKEIK
jgi:hypothetical protein